MCKSQNNHPQTKKPGPRILAQLCNARCPPGWAKLPSLVCQIAVQNHQLRPNCSRLLRFFTFRVCKFGFLGFGLVFANLPLHLDGQGLSSCSQKSPRLPQELPKSHFQHPRVLVRQWQKMIESGLG